ERAEQPDPPISPFIAAQTQEPQEDAAYDASTERTFGAMLAERLDAAVQHLLREIACEVLGRELLLAPVDVDAIVRRLRERYRVDDHVGARTGENGDLVLSWEGCEIDASLANRLELALDGASP